MVMLLTPFYFDVQFLGVLGAGLKIQNIKLVPSRHNASLVTLGPASRDQRHL